MNEMISYPKESESVSQAAIGTLKRFDDILTTNMFAVMCSNSSYRWEHVPSLAGDLYFALIKNSDSKEVVTAGIRELSNLSPDDLIRKIEHSQVSQGDKESKSY